VSRQEGLLPLKKVKAAVSVEEWQTRIDLAACYRLISAYGMSDLIYNHISARIPGQGAHYLINPYGMLYDEITASSLVKIDVEGHTLLQPDHGYNVNVAGFYLHAPIHKTRPDVQCIIHTHTRAGTAVSGLKEGLLPLSQTAPKRSTKHSTPQRTCKHELLSRPGSSLPISRVATAARQPPDRRADPRRRRRASCLSPIGAHTIRIAAAGCTPVVTGIAQRAS
jgi:hypothetical protein